MLEIIMNAKKIAKFIENDLVRKVRIDQWHYKIGNERDLEHSIYYHLRKSIYKTNIPRRRIKISSNYTIVGHSIYKHKKSKITNKDYLKKSKFIMPDILISFIPRGQESLDHKIAFELKAPNPGIYHNINRLSGRDFQKDFKKLNKLKQSHVVDHCYLFYLYSDETKNEPEVRKQILNSRIKMPKKKNAKKKYFKPLVINRFLNPKTKKIIKDIDGRREKLRRIFRSYEGDDPRFSKKPKKTDGGRKNPKRSAGAKKAWDTMRSPKWLGEHKNSPIARMILKNKKNT